MTLRDDLLPVFEGARQLIQDFGLRQHRIWIRAGQWSTNETLLGALTNTDVELLPRPKVRELGPNRLEASKITPEFATGGWDPLDLLPDAAPGSDFYFVVRNPRGDLNPYALIDVNATKNFTFTLVLERLDLASPNF